MHGPAEHALNGVLISCPDVQRRTSNVLPPGPDVQCTSDHLRGDRALRMVDFKVAVAAQEFALGRLLQDTLPGMVREVAQIQLERLRCGQTVMERECRVVTLVATALTGSAERADQVQFSLPASLLLHDVRLQPVVDVALFALDGAEQAAPATHDRGTAGLAGSHGGKRSGPHGSQAEPPRF